MDSTLESSGIKLSAHLAEPSATAGAGGSLHGLLICHGFPVRGREAPASGKSFPELADRIAAELGWLVLTMNFRGCGLSGGDFSLGGWLDDITAGVDHLTPLGVDGVWLVGFGTGGALCVAEGARNPAVRGVAAVSTPADFDDWARNPRRLLLHAREVGVIRDPEFPPAFDRWAAQLKEVSPVRAAAELAPRPFLVLHGENDDLVSSLDARVIADAHGSAELRIIAGAGHELRHDPRAVAILFGWLSRQHDAHLLA